MTTNFSVMKGSGKMAKNMVSNMYRFLVHIKPIKMKYALCITVKQGETYTITWQCRP